jgi:hypothetical protein
MTETPAIRKTVLCVEEIRHDGGPPLETPLRKGWCAVVLRNPFAGRHEPDLMWMMEAMKPIGLMVAERLLEGLGGDPAAIEAYGKGGVVGSGGELEHGALWHVAGGYAMRGLLGQALSIVPSMTKSGSDSANEA